MYFNIYAEPTVMTVEKMRSKFLGKALFVDEVKRNEDGEVVSARVLASEAIFVHGLKNVFVRCTPDVIGNTFDFSTKLIISKFCFENHIPFYAGFLYDRMSRYVYKDNHVIEMYHCMKYAVDKVIGEYVLEYQYLMWNTKADLVLYVGDDSCKESDVGVLRNRLFENLTDIKKAKHIISKLLLKGHESRECRLVEEILRINKYLATLSECNTAITDFMEIANSLEQCDWRGFNIAVLDFKADAEHINNIEDEFARECLEDALDLRFDDITVFLSRCNGELGEMTTDEYEMLDKTKLIHETNTILEWCEEYPQFR